MSVASIPVDVLNPGQVFASLGFLEIADVLCTGAKGKFKENAGKYSFEIITDCDENPFDSVLRFIAEAEVDSIDPRNARTFPCREREANEKTWPVRFKLSNYAVELSHWCDGSSRDNFKLFAGQQVALKIVEELLHGKGKNSIGFCALWEKNNLVNDPFGASVPDSGTLYFDPRRNWKAIDAGYSPDKVKHGVCTFPIVEVLAAFGLEHARPSIDGKKMLPIEKQRVTYAIWYDDLPPCLARPVFAGAEIGIRSQRFYFYLGISGKIKTVEFAQEEI